MQYPCVKFRRGADRGSQPCIASRRSMPYPGEIDAIWPTCLDVAHGHDRGRAGGQRSCVGLPLRLCTAADQPMPPTSQTASLTRAIRLQFRLLEVPAGLRHEGRAVGKTAYQRPRPPLRNGASSMADGETDCETPPTIATVPDLRRAPWHEDMDADQWGQSAIARSGPWPLTHGEAPAVTSDRSSARSCAASRSRAATVRIQWPVPGDRRAPVADVLRSADRPSPPGWCSATTLSGHVIGRITPCLETRDVTSSAEARYATRPSSQPVTHFRP